MSNDRNPENRKGKNVQSGKLLLKKQQISRQQLGGVTGGGTVSAVASAVVSAASSAGMSLAGGPWSAVASAAGSAFAGGVASNHLEDRINDGTIQRNMGKIAGDIDDWAHKNLHFSW